MSPLTIEHLIKSMEDRTIEGNIQSKENKVPVFKLIKKIPICRPDTNLSINSGPQHSFLHLSLIHQFLNLHPVHNFHVKVNNKVTENILHKRRIQSTINFIHKISLSLISLKWAHLLIILKITMEITIGTIEDLMEADLI